MPRKNQAKHRRGTTRSEKEQVYAVQMERCIADSPFSNLERLQNFPLYTPRQDLTNFLVRYEVFKRVLQIQGSIIECGVLRGGGLIGLGTVQRHFRTNEPTAPGRGFRYFQRLPKTVEAGSLERI